MENLDAERLKNDEKVTALAQAMTDTDATTVAASIVTLINDDVNKARQDLDKFLARVNDVDINDAEALAVNGGRKLSHAEREVYAKFQAHAKSDSQTKVKAFVDLLETLPTTVYMHLFNELQRENELVKRVFFVPTVTSSMLVPVSGVVTAYWGARCDDVQELLTDGFTLVNSNASKLSGFLPICNAVMVTSPVWLDAYIRQYLKRVIDLSIEYAIIDGDGDQMPIGMTRDLDLVVSSAYQPKTPVVLQDLSVATIGSQVLAPLTNNGTRKLDKVLFIVNPSDYYTSIAPLFNARNANGDWTIGYPYREMDVLQSAAVPQGRMVTGIGSDYFLAMGAVKIDESEHARFIQDEVVYRVKVEASGQPISNDSFTVFDITAVTNPTTVSPPTGE